MMIITVKSRRELENMIRAYRSAGFNLVTYGKKMVELENENDFIRIEVKRG